MVACLVVWFDGWFLVLRLAVLLVRRLYGWSLGLLVGFLVGRLYGSMVGYLV